MRAIKELKELKRRIEERGESLSSVSDVFMAQVFTLSEMSAVNRGIEGAMLFVVISNVYNNI
ncbi:MAG: hypothetical protein ACXQT6_04640 [Candidatus Methanospirareceae archaeon]